METDGAVSTLAKQQVICSRYNWRVYFYLFMESRRAPHRFKNQGFVCARNIYNAAKMAKQTHNIKCGLA